MAGFTIVCGILETCCDVAGAGGVCCTVCEDCVSNTCQVKSNNSPCGTGLKCCSGTCTDILNDENNCGFCGVVCGGGQTCSSGTCV